MGSPATAPTAWYFFSNDLPDEEVIVPIMTEQGLAMAVRTGTMPEQTLDELNQGVATSAMPERTLDELNRAAQFVLGVGLAQICQQPKPPDLERKE